MKKYPVSFANKVSSFLTQLQPDFNCPRGIQVLNPYVDERVKKVVSDFYTRYYADVNTRIFLFGINPGRLGSGVTGISFTDPVQLKNVADIDHPFALKAELSSKFVYEMIDRYGGLELFCNSFFLTAISPVGFTRGGKNLNYYDDELLESRVRPFIIRKIEEQCMFGASRELAICLGEGQNFKYFKGLNEEFGWFKEIKALPHPRWIMQYRRKDLHTFISRYVETLKSAADLLKIS